jgi:hypothetical protein
VRLTPHSPRDGESRRDFDSPPGLRPLPRPLQQSLSQSALILHSPAHTSILRRAGDHFVNACVAMRAMRRGLTHTSVCHPKTDATHRLTALGARNFEQTPDRGDKHSGHHDRANKSKDKNSGSGTHQSSGNDKKSNRAAHGSVAAAHQVLAYRHERESYLGVA